MAFDEKKFMEELKRLPPKERIKKLEEFKKLREEERKKEEQDMQRAMSESLEELKLDQMLQEIEVPKADEVKVDELFQKEADIEEQIKKEKIRIQTGGENYAARIEEMLPRGTIDQIQNWYQQDNKPPTQEEFLRVYEQAREAYDQVRDQMQKTPGDTYQSQSQEIIENVVSSMDTMRKMGYKHGFFN